MKVPGMARTEAAYSSASVKQNSWKHSFPAVTGGLQGTKMTNVQAEFYNNVLKALPSTSTSTGASKAKPVASGAEALTYQIRTAMNKSKAESESVSSSKIATELLMISDSCQFASKVPYMTQTGELEKELTATVKISSSEKLRSQEFSCSAKNNAAIVAGSTNGTTDSGMNLLSSSASDDDQQAIDDRKQKRMLSNRESARRSRQRKQQHLEELREELLKLRAENSHMLSQVSVVSEQFAQISQENHYLQAHAVDLSQQLQRLNQNNASRNPSCFIDLDLDIQRLVMPITIMNSVQLSQP